MFGHLPAGSMKQTQAIKTEKINLKTVGENIESSFSIY